MATFATEDDVRERLQAHDTETIPSGLVTAMLEDAHEEVLRRFDLAYEETPLPAGLVAGEALLASARLLQALASADAIEQQHLSIGGQRFEAGSRFAALLAMADQAEARAWEMLEPYLLSTLAQRELDVSDSTPVLGGE